MRRKNIFITIFMILAIFLICFLGWFYLRFIHHNFKFIPDTLPVAHVNLPYKQMITIEGGRPIYTSTNISDDVGIKVENVMIQETQSYDIVNNKAINEKKVWTSDTNRFLISGIPSKKGKIKISFGGLFQGGGNKEFDKTYQLNIE